MKNILALSEAASIALHGLIIVARSDKMINVDQIAERLQSSRHHVAKVFQRLVKYNYIVSHRGPNGGFSLNKSPQEITFLDIYEAIEGKIKITKCPFNKIACPFEECIMGDITQKLTRNYIDYLSCQSLDMYLDVEG